MKFAAALTLVGATGLGTAAAVHAATDTDDNLSPANTAITAHLKTGTKFTSAGTIDGVAVNVSCTIVSASGKTPKKGLTVTLPNPPTFSGCSDQLGGTDTVATNMTNGKWKLSEIDAKNDEAGTEPNATGDKAKLTFPKAGAAFSSSILAGCVITVAPTAAASVTGTYNDAGTFTITHASIPVSATGCTSSATASVSSTIVLSKPVFDAG